LSFGTSTLNRFFRFATRSVNNALGQVPVMTVKNLYDWLVLTVKLQRKIFTTNNPSA